MITCKDCLRCERCPYRARYDYTCAFYCIAFESKYDGAGGLINEQSYSEQPVRRNEQPYSEQQVQREGLKEFFDAVMSIDFSDERKRRQEAKIAKSLKRQRKRRNRTIALGIVAHSIHKGIDDFLK